MHIELTQDYNRMASSYNAGMQRVIEGFFPQLHLPRSQIAFWRTKTNNCYNYATNRFSDDFLQPGRIQLPRRAPIVQGTFEKYVVSALSRIEDDGLRPLGQDFLYALCRCDPDERPIALFFKDHGKLDFHWYSIRLGNQQDPEPKILWAEKYGEARANKCTMRLFGTDFCSIFAEAAERGYYYFAGYYAVPKSLESPPDSDENKESLKQDLLKAAEAANLIVIESKLDEYIASGGAFEHIDYYEPTPSKKNLLKGLLNRP